MRIARHGVLFLGLLATTACGSDPKSTPQPQVVSVSLTPGGPLTLGQAQSKGFMATVSGTSNTAVTWAVEESGGGSVTQAGVYTAPYASGPFHVAATSVADPSKSARAMVSVSVLSAVKTIGPAGGFVSSPGGATLEIPPGALAQDTVITLSEAVAPLPSALHPIGSVVRCDPDGLAFARPVGIHLPLPAGTSGASLAWTRAGATSFSDASDFEVLGGTVSGGELRGTLTHCSGGGAVAAASSRNINGVKKTIYVPPGAPRAVVGADLSRFDLLAYPVSGDGYGPQVLGSGTADGTFRIPGMPPSGEYLVVLAPGQAYLLSEDSPDLTNLGAGRPDLVALKPSGSNQAGILVSMDGLAPWKNATDVLEVLSPGSDSWAFWSEAFGCTVPAAIAEGATALSEAFLPLTGDFCAFGHHIEAAKGDRVYLAQLQGKTTSGGELYQAQARWAALSAFDLGDGQWHTEHGSFIDVPQSKTLDCDIRFSEFAAQYPNLPDGFVVSQPPSGG